MIFGQMRGFWNAISDRFFFTSFRKNILILTSGNATVQAISLLTYPILTRLYPDEVFGQYALFNSFVIMLTFTITLSYEAAIPLPPDDRSALILKRSTIAITATFGLFLTIIASSLEYLNIYAPLKSFLYILPLVAFVSSLLQIYRYWYLRINNLRKYFSFLIGYRLLYIITAIAIAFMSLEFTNPLISALLLSSLFILLVIILYHRSDFGLSWNIKEAKVMLSKHYRFPKFTLPSFFVSHLTNQVPIFLIAYYFDQASTGQYSVAFGLLFLPQSMLLARVSEALYSDSDGNVEALKLKVIKIWKTVFLIMTGPCFLLFFTGSEIIPFLLGDQWILAGEISELFALQMFFGSFISAVSSTLNILNLQSISLKGAFIRLVYTIVAFIAAGFTSDLMVGIKVLVICSIALQITMGAIIFNKLVKKQSEVQ